MIYENDLNLVPSGVPLMIKLSQYDKTMPTLKFNLYNGAEVFNVPTGCNVYIQGTKADKTGFSYVCTVNNNEVSVAVSEQMTVFAGRVPCELVITKSGERKGSANFFLDIEPCALADDTVISETDIPILQQMPELVERAEAAADEAEGLVGDVVDVKAEVNDIFNIYGPKNLLPYPYYQTTQTVNGITTTDNGDGTLTFNGTSTASGVIFRLHSNDANIEIPLSPSKYIVTWVEADKHNPQFRLDIALTKSDNTTEIKNGQSGTINIDNTNGQYKGIYSVGIFTISGQTVSNLTFKPMIRLATDHDSTYQPYAPTNAKLNEEKMSYADNGVLGAKNLIPYPYYRESGYTHNGITSIYDEDGVITVNGTAVNSNAYFGVFNSATSSIALKPNTDYILSIELQNATNTSFFLANNSVDMVAIRNKATGYYEKKFRTPATLGTLTMALYWGTGVTETNAIVKPMIRLATDHDSTYQPYAMTNKELTERVAEGLDTITFVNAKNYNNLTKLVKMGNLRILHIGCNLTSLTPDSATSWIHVITIPDGAKYQTRMTGYDINQNIPVALRAEGTKILLLPLAQLSVNDFITGTLIYEV